MRMIKKLHWNNNKWIIQNYEKKKNITTPLTHLPCVDLTEKNIFLISQHFFLLLHQNWNCGEDQLIPKLKNVQMTCL